MNSVKLIRYIQDKKRETVANIQTVDRSTGIDVKMGIHREIYTLRARAEQYRHFFYCV